MITSIEIPAWMIDSVREPSSKNWSSLKSVRVIERWVYFDRPLDEVFERVRNWFGNQEVEVTLDYVLKSTGR
jgi:hypothetical protein